MASKPFTLLLTVIAYSIFVLILIAVFLPILWNPVSRSINKGLGGPEHLQPSYDLLNKYGTDDQFKGWTNDEKSHAEEETDHLPGQSSKSLPGKISALIRKEIKSSKQSLRGRKIKYIKALNKTKKETKSKRFSGLEKIVNKSKSSTISKDNMRFFGSGKQQRNNSFQLTQSIYGSDCPHNPHKPQLQYLLRRWMDLDKYYNLSSFLCGGSLIGLLRDGDLIPYDRDIDMCITLEHYEKLRAIRSRKPFNPYRSQIQLAIQMDFMNNDVEFRTRVDCKGRSVESANDQCSFQAPAARLISRGVYVDVFVFRNRSKHLYDDEYKKVMRVKDVFPLKRCIFMNVETTCPRDEMAYIRKYYEPNALTNPHYRCRNNTWVPATSDAKETWKIWFRKHLT